MFGQRRWNQRLWLLVSGLLLSSIWCNAIAGIVCPYVGFRSRACSVTHSVSRFDESDSLADEGPQHMHCADSEMSRADSHSAMFEAGTNDLPDIEEINLLSTEALTSAAATEQNEQCSHCLMHLQPWTTSSLRLVVLNDSVYPLAAGNLSVPVVVTFQPLTALLDVHDHGPPSFAPRYVLNNTFRI
jgi:hypothetical protein